MIPENIFSISSYGQVLGHGAIQGFLISGSALPTFATGFDWYSQGTILRPGRLGSIVEVKRIQGAIFNSKEEAEQDGFRLCKDWIDKGS